MKRYLVIESLEQLRAISDALRLEMITLLTKDAYTGKQLAGMLSLSPSKVHYHLKELEHHGFVHVVRTEEKNGIVQKFYRSVAFDFKVSEDLLPSLREDTLLQQEAILNHLRSSITRLYNAPDESFLLFAEEEKRPPLYAFNGEVKAPRDEIKAWIKKYRALLEELNDMEERHLQRIKAGEAEDTGEVFYFVGVGFMTNEQIYVADDESLPEGFVHADDVTVGKMCRRKTEHDPSGK